MTSQPKYGLQAAPSPIKRLLLSALILSPFYFTLTVDERRRLLVRLCESHSGK